MLEKESKFFRIYHWVIVSFCLYIIVYIPAMMWLREYDIQFPCPYRETTGQNCPLCGITRDLGNIFSFPHKNLNPLTNFIAGAFFAETVYRGFLFLIWKNSILWNHIRWICTVDAGGHLLILLLFAFFCVASL